MDGRYADVDSATDCCTFVNCTKFVLGRNFSSFCECYNDSRRLGGVQNMVCCGKVFNQVQFFCNIFGDVIGLLHVIMRMEIDVNCLMCGDRCSVSLANSV